MKVGNFSDNRPVLCGGTSGVRGHSLEGCELRLTMSSVCLERQDEGCVGKPYDREGHVRFKATRAGYRAGLKLAALYMAE